MRLLILAAALAAVAGCASQDQAKVASAATTPLSDLNLVKAPIPPVLKAAQAAPYSLPADASCAGFQAEVKSLDEALGPDLDAPPAAPQGLLERGAGTATDLATGELQRTAEGVIPFRGWIRRLSGAERYSRQVTAAITAGAARRAFLKGYAHAKDCPIAAG